MIYSPPAQADAELKYRPSVVEVADAGIRGQYEATAMQMFISREGSEYIRKKIAEISIEARLEQLAKLPANWDSYGTENPSRMAIITALAIAKAFVEFDLLPDAISASSEGGVAICFMRNQRYADIECFNSGDVLAVRYSKNDEPKAWVVEPSPDATNATIRTVSAYLSV